MSVAATNLPGEPKHAREPESEQRTPIWAIDLRRACFGAECDPSEEQPDEHPRKNKGMRALPHKHTYGTRIAVGDCHCECSSALVQGVDLT